MTTKTTIGLYPEHHRMIVFLRSKDPSRPSAAYLIRKLLAEEMVRKGYADCVENAASAASSDNAA